MVTSSDTIALRAIRTLRCLRPLRLLSRVDALRNVITALFRSVPGLMNVGLILLLFWLIFRSVDMRMSVSFADVISILGVQLFGGRFSRCVDEKMRVYDARVVADKEACLNTTGATWYTPEANFDHVGFAFVALLQVCAVCHPLCRPLVAAGHNEWMAGHHDQHDRRAWNRRAGSHRVC